MVSIIINKVTSLALIYFAPFPIRTLEIGLINKPITITIIKVLKSIINSSQKNIANKLKNSPANAVNIVLFISLCFDNKTKAIEKSAVHNKAKILPFKLPISNLSLKIINKPININIEEITIFLVIFSF